MFIRHILKTTASSESVNSAVEIGMSIRTTAYGFVPTQITGCSLWLDAADSSSSSMTLSDSTITAWKDKSGNGVTFSIGGTPTLSNAAYNGLSSVYFNGSTNFYNTTFSLNLINHSFFIVVTETSGGNAGVLIFYNISAGNYDVYASNSLEFASPEFGIEGSYGAQPYSNLTYGIYGDTSPNGGTYNLYKNGTSVISKTGLVAATSTGINIGSRVYPGYYAYFMTGYVSEVIVYNTSLETTQRQQVESYLAQKWGMTSSLPVAHPGLTTTVYKSTYLKTAGPKMNIATMTPFYTAFSPQQIGGLALWLDAADSSTITGNVTSVREKANNVALSVSGTVTTTTLGSKPSLNFGGSGYLSGAVNNLLTGTSFVVFKTTNANAGNWFPFFTWRDNAGQANFPGFGYIYNAAGNLIGPYTTFVGSGTPTTSVSIGNSYLTSYSWSGTTTNVGFNGATPTSGTQSAYASTETLIWIGYDNGPIITVNIGEIILYNSVLTNTQRQQIESYLAQKWGVTSSLPSGHLQFTQPAGAITSLSLANSKMTLKRSIVATGGTVTIANGYKIHTFTTVGSTNFVVTSGGSVQVLIVSGGGSGGGNVGGGGGAGGAVFNNAVSIASGTFTVIVGNGGAIDSGINQGQNGGSSSFNNITVVGGGAGGVIGGYSGLAGACGGGAGTGFTYGTGSVGFNGGSTSGTCGGGGGGMGSSGTAGSGYNGGAGGAGATYTIGGQSYTVCGGGGGAGYNVAGTNGVGGSGGTGGGATGTTVNNIAGGTNLPTPNSGGGGGGGTNNGNDYASDGASGIVIIAYIYP